MPTVSRTATFAAPVPVVWATLVDPSWSGSWFGADTSITTVSGEGLGTRQEVTASVKGKGVSLVIETTTFEEGSLLTQRLVEVGGKEIDGLTELSYELSEHGTGTAVTVSSSVPEAKGMMGRMIGLGRAHLEAAAAQQTLKRLERFVVERYNQSLESGVDDGAVAEPGPGSVPESPPSENSSGVLGIPEAPPQDGMPGSSGTEGRLGEAPEGIGGGNRVESSDPATLPPESSEPGARVEEPQFLAAPEAPEIDIPEAPPMPEQPEPPATDAALATLDQDSTALDHQADEAPETTADRTDPERGGSAESISVTEAVSAITPSEEVVLERVRSWAKTHPLVRTSRFSESLTLEFNPLWQCIVTRVFEEREEGQVHVPSNHGAPDAPRYNCLLESIPVEPPTDFEGRSWTLIREGSERVVPCPASCAGGQVQCTRCQGGTVLCSSCIGSGQKTRTRQGAGGQSYQESYPCSWCGGSGRRPCDTCRGNGWLVCPDCDGSSQVIQFTCAVISNRPEAAEVGTALEAPPEVKLKKVKDEEWRGVLLSDGSVVPAGLPEELSSRLQVELEETQPNERLRKLEVKVLPVTTVVPEGEADSRAHVIGEGARIFSRKATSRNRIVTLSALLTLLVVVLLLVVLVL